jgi:outer membrane protein
MPPLKALRLVLTTSVALAVASPALADDLREALVSAYNTNPTLQGARATQRATDEGVPLARARALPSLSGQMNYTQFLRQNPLSFVLLDHSFSTDLNLGLPVYAGGRDQELGPRGDAPGSRPDRPTCAGSNRWFSRPTRRRLHGRDPGR